MTTTFQEAPVTDVTASLQHVHPSSVMDHPIPEQLLPEHHSSVPSLSDSPLPVSDELPALARGNGIASASTTLAATLQNSETLESELDEVANLLAQQPRVDGGPRRPMNAFLIFARWRRMQMAQDKTKTPTEAAAAELAGTLAIRNSKRKHTSRKVGPKPAEVSAALGEEWKSLSQEQQAPFHRKATQLRADFDRKNPEYKFTRGSKGCAKKRRQEAMELKAVARQAQRQAGKQSKALGGSRDSNKGKASGGRATASGPPGFIHAASSAQDSPMSLDGQVDHLHRHPNMISSDHGQVLEGHDPELGELPEWSARKMLSEGSPLGRSPQPFPHHRRVSEGGGMAAWRHPAAPMTGGNYTWQYADNEGEWGKNAHFLQDPAMPDRQYMPLHHPHAIPHGNNYQLAYGPLPEAHLAHDGHLDNMPHAGRGPWSALPNHHSPMHAGMQLPQYSNMFASAPMGGGVTDNPHWRPEGPYEYEYPQAVRPQLLPSFEGSPRSYQVPLPASAPVPGPGNHPVALFQPHGRQSGGKNIYAQYPAHATGSPNGGKMSQYRGDDRQALRHQRPSQVTADTSQLHPSFAPEVAAVTPSPAPAAEAFAGSGKSEHSGAAVHHQAGHASQTKELKRETSDPISLQEQHQEHAPEGSALRLSLTGPVSVIGRQQEALSSHEEDQSPKDADGAHISVDSTNREAGVEDVGASPNQPAGTIADQVSTQPQTGIAVAPTAATTLTTPSFVAARRESRTSMTLDAAMRQVADSPGSNDSSMTPLSTPREAAIKDLTEGLDDDDDDDDAKPERPQRHRTQKRVREESVGQHEQHESSSPEQ